MLVTHIQPVDENPLEIVVPFVFSTVRAGFPSPADDYLDATLDLNTFLVKHPAATFIVQARGDSMREAGINDGARLVVDRSIEAHDGSIVVAAVGGNFTVKRFRRKGDRVWLEAALPGFPVIEVTDEDSIFGVVLHAINTFK